MIGVIGGSGLYDPTFLDSPQEVIVDTPYGDVMLIAGKAGDRDVFFIPRHGKDHEYPPHKVNYRGNIWALKKAGARRILSVNTVGSLDPSIVPGSLAFPEDFIDFTKNRVSTFYDNETIHVDMSKAYCPELRDILIRSALKLTVDLKERVVYVCTEGPRFETPAEIGFLRKIGGQVVGMVGYPEVALAREAGLCYASICIVTNYGCGLGHEDLHLKDLMKTVSKNMGTVRGILTTSIKLIQEERDNCRCESFIKDAKV